MSAVYAFFVAVFVYKDMTIAKVPKVLLDSANMSAMLLYIITNAVMFCYLMTSEQIPQELAAWMLDKGLGVVAFLLFVNVVLLLAGNVMEPSSIVLIMAPILFPVAMKLGIDPIHFGIMMVVNMEVGMCHPPVGLNLYVASGITKMGITELTIAVWPWLLTMLVFLVVVTYWPTLTLWLPQTLGHDSLAAASRGRTSGEVDRRAAPRLGGPAGARLFRSVRPVRRSPATPRRARPDDRSPGRAGRAAGGPRQGGRKWYNFEFTRIYPVGVAGMAVERTLSIIKPDAVAANLIGKIYSRFETNGLKIVAAQMRWLSSRGGRGLLRSSPRTAVFQGSGRFHDVGPGDDPGARRRKRHREEPRSHGRHRSEEGRTRHDPRRLREIDRRQRRARLRRAGHRARPRSPISSPPWRSTAADGCDRRGRDQPARPRRRGPRGLLRRPGREAVSREAGVALGAPAPRRRTSTR